MAITETGLSAIASGAESSIKSQGGSIEGREGNYRVTFPEGTERLSSSSISAWKRRNAYPHPLSAHGSPMSPASPVGKCPMGMYYPIGLIGRTRP